MDFGICGGPEASTPRTKDGCGGFPINSTSLLTVVHRLQNSSS